MFRAVDRTIVVRSATSPAHVRAAVGDSGSELGDEQAMILTGLLIDWRLIADGLDTLSIGLIERRLSPELIEAVCVQIGYASPRTDRSGRDP